MTFLSENSTQITIHAASSNSDQACEITADSAVEITAKALAYIYLYSWFRFSEISFFLWSFTKTSSYEDPSTTSFSTWLYPTSSTL